MFEYPDDLKYTNSHEYIRLEDDTATVGITAFAIDQLGDIVFLDLPEVGTRVEKGQTFGTIESVKAVEDIYSPVTGTVMESNMALVDEPEIIGKDPYGASWLLKVNIEDVGELDGTMSASEYRSKVEGS
ncbi:MAG: glycine cleavage system protein GcvH [Pseudanabaena sp. M135S2SP2A07QC]|jgi:glycine cleavage system H protein|nr:glycine cleavage system protein GcvH [Pseudanabaena sp. M090S1SP2A07QC]MCA6506605.1 glycine cleavage system protein GcvH [Pseudanabaena sp. M172S2SP2A07QC]MCA6510512.1 glycine cleavage system protein GcvH [Pseudanabaena sp. M109S1SP2A07QC]MCA6520167.1 glycine cleavage system protein GcvH [Pseudanabaena sp. M110S1SP2A07QC]MCA6522807.1 glycine cleavage system protein GcvH [Pseudanabaena sp. M051S1SP2A07QC]MCA6526976.1 glycine cleavage system protein GcvH [Pseudanabaena sp. M179S2SP2A07QC]MCA